jgi:tetratricopeptide (TPR) repeat protein
MGAEPRSPGDELPADVAREIKQVAHFGRARNVKDSVAEAAQAFDDGDYEKVIAALADAKRDAPRSTTVRELLGLAYYHLGRFREAARELAAYRRLSGEQDQDAPLADAERALGHPDRAVAILTEEPRDAVPEDVAVEGLVVLAGALRDLGRASEAVAVLQSGPVRPEQVLPHHLRLWYALADALEDAGNRRDARSWWDAIYAEDPEFFDVSSRRLGVKRR